MLVHAKNYRWPAAAINRRHLKVCIAVVKGSDTIAVIVFIDRETPESVLRGFGINMAFFKSKPAPDTVGSGPPDPLVAIFGVIVLNLSFRH